MVGMLDALSLKDTKIGLETLGEMGYDPRAITLVLNRADSSGITPLDVEQLLGRAPDVLVGSDRAIPARSRAVSRSWSPSRSRRRPGRASSPSGTWRSRRAGGRVQRQRAAAACCGRRADDGTARADRELAGRAGELAERQRRRARPVRGAEEPIHLALVSELGPSLRRRGQRRRPQRVESEIGEQRSQEAALSRDDRGGWPPRSRTTSSATARSSGCSPTRPSRRSWSTAPRHLDRAGRLSPTTLTFSDSSHLRRIITKMVGQIGRRIDESSPLVDARLPDGSRVNAIIPPLSLSGPLLTIRKFAQNRFHMAELIEIGTLSKDASCSSRAASRRS